MADVEIVVPTWNESKNITEFLDRTRRAMKGFNYEVVVVDDNSPDGTANIAASYGEKYGHTDVVVRSGKKGYGSAFRNGLKHAVKKKPKHVVIMDSDLSHRPEDIPRLLGIVGKNLVQGSRYISGGRILGWGFRRRLTSLIANFITRVLFQTGICENTTSFKVFSLEVARVLAEETESDGFEWLIEAILVVREHGFNIIEVPITFVDRRKGESKLGIVEIVGWFSFVLTYLFKR